MSTNENSAEYYRRREAQEREMAEKATTDEARFIHLALAENYRTAAEEADRERHRRPAARKS